MRYYLAAFLCVALWLYACPARADDLSPESINARIRQYRTTQATLTITDAAGRPLADTAVTIRQARHQFLFGSNIFALRPDDASEAQKAYQQRYADLLNFATLPFYWGSYEPTEGQVDAARLAAMADWCNAHGIRTKGHPLCWQQVFPRWLMKQDLEEIHRLQIGRIGREVSAMAGKIDTWDVVNEAVSMPRFTSEATRVPQLCDKLGRLKLLKECFTTARAANPAATLVLNDYDTSPAYEELIKECLDAGVPIDVIGIQCHQHTGYWGAEKTWDVAQRFSKFGKPLNFTELTITSGRARNDWLGAHTDWPTTAEDEQRQMKQVVEFYSILFSHPAVKAITWWDFTDRGAWLGAPAGLIRTDMTPKPAYLALMKKIKGEWWTAQIKTTTDAAGKVSFRGFLGDYVMEAGTSKATFSLNEPGECAVPVVAGRAY